VCIPPSACVHATMCMCATMCVCVGLGVRGELAAICSCHFDRFSLAPYCITLLALTSPIHWHGTCGLQPSKMRSRSDTLTIEHRQLLGDHDAVSEQLRRITKKYVRFQPCPALPPLNASEECLQSSSAFDG